jgi:DNA-binding transcriptional ArsR family regulator/NAD-dependent dihydropyrimidine dehydrogenase PreA subunit
MIEYRKRTKILQAMLHPARLRILEILTDGPACVCDLTSQTQQRQAYISQHLMLLRQTGMVKTTRIGHSIQYELAQPEITLNLLKCILQDHECKSADPKEVKISGAENNNSWHGIPREIIEWYPTIVMERCTGCGLCATSCDRGVFAMEYKTNRPVVKMSQECVVGCTTCATICTQDAIELPSQGYIRQVIKKYEVVTQSKNMLAAHPDQYYIMENALSTGANP